MSALSKSAQIGVVGAGAMGLGIAQVAAAFGHEILLYEANDEIRAGVLGKLKESYDRRVKKGKLSEDDASEILKRFTVVDDLSAFAQCRLVIEAVFEDLKIKTEVFSQLEEIVAEDAILATNTSSLSITSIGAACKKPGRVIGAHFFNPAHVMPLVEIIPGLETEEESITQARCLIDEWGKTTVLAKDTPGFIVNRVARPFYGEALRIVEEGSADFATVDWAMKSNGGFRMGPFELMDFIGNDVNLKVTESVFEAFYYDSRYRPSLYQKRLVEAGHLGKKTGRGFYDYGEEASNPSPNQNRALGKQILTRILSMLINEAADAVYMGVASVQDIDLAMTKGVNYPKGLLEWADELGARRVLAELGVLYEHYLEDRYRPSPLLRELAKENAHFYTMTSTEV